MQFYGVLTLVMALLQQEKRLSYRALKLQFALDDEALEALKIELIKVKQLAVDQDGEMLVWTGGVPALATPSLAAHSLAMAPLPDAPAAAQSAPEAERRQVTVLFCDLVDSTKLAQQLDPEDYRAVVRAYQEAAVTAMQPFEGYVAQYLGDGLLVYFGWPQAHEDAAARAVYASLAIVEAMTPLNSHLEPRYGVQVAVRCGLRTGVAVIGAVGSGARQEQLALGDTPNIAARLQGLADPNTVVLSAATAHLVHGVFALEDLGVQALKGVAEPMPVCRVVGLLETPDDGAETPAKAPFLVGRDEEVGLLRRRWEQSKAGLGQVVLLSGEAGIGKSTLTTTLRAHVEREGLPRIALRCSPYHTNSALYPVIAHVQRWLRLPPDASPEAKLAILEQGLRSYRLPLEEAVPLLAALLSVPLSERYPPLQLTPQQQKQQTLDTLVAWMLEEAERQPVLAVWEDLHWADPSTLELLSLVIEQTPTVPMLHMLTFRPVFTPPWPSRSHLTPLTLNRLERPQVEALITHLAGGKALPAEVVQHIVTKTDGVPLFVEELTKMLLESEVLRAEADHYALTGPLSTVAIPATLQDSLLARLDRLPTAREVAQLGAVLGREFTYEVLRAISPLDEATLQARLAQLVAAELLYQRGRPPRATYIFKHALIQDAAYQSMLRTTRQHYHQQLAHLFEARYPETVATQPELLAHHYTEAGFREQAVDYWQRAGQRALQRSANPEAIQHLSTGLALLATLPETLARAQQELGLLTTLGPALLATKGYAAPEVVQAYTRARTLCQQLGETTELFPVLWNLWLFSMARAEHQTAIELGEQCLQLAQRAQDTALLLAAHLAMGSSLFYLGQLSLACTHLEQGMALYDPEQHHGLAFRYGGIDLGMPGFGYCGWSLWLQGYPEQARARSDQALTLAQHLAHPYTLARALYYDTFLHQLSRNAPAVREQAQAATTVASEQGFALVQALGPLMHGWAVVVQDKNPEGITQIQQGLTTYQATGAEFQRPHFLGMLAEALGTLDQPQEGLVALDEALTLVEQTGECYYAAELHRLRGELLLAQAVGATHASPLQAAACFQQALDIARQQQAKSLELRAAVSLSRLWQQQGKREEARELLAAVYGWFTEGFDTADLQEAKALLDELA